MNVKKIVLLGGIFCFAGVSASGESLAYSFGFAFKRERFPIGSFLLREASFVAIKSSLHGKMINDGFLNRVIESGIWYNETPEEFIGKELSPNGKVVIRPLAYAVADRLVSPIVNESHMVKAAVENFSPEMQQEIKNTVTVISASALAKSAEALYDSTYNSKRLGKSAKEFAVNTAVHVTNKVVYHAAVKPIAKEVITPELKPLVEFAAGYATTYAIILACQYAQAQ